MRGHNGPCDLIAANILTMHRLLTGWGAARDAQPPWNPPEGLRAAVMVLVVPHVEGNVVSRLLK